MKIIYASIFYFMLYLRKPFFMCAKFLSFLVLLSALALLFFMHSYLSGSTLLAVSFVTFLLRQFYDQILLKINPTNNALILID